jgi:hypothetical protein
MPRARTKKELVDFGGKEYKNLITLVNDIPKEKRETITLFDNWEISDIIAHLNAWHNLFLQWYEVGMKGDKPEIPAPGYTFKDTPALNEKIYKENKDLSLQEALKKFKNSHKKLMDIVNDHTENELETKKMFKWTGSTNLASYLASATSSHYVWAIKEIKKYIK